MVQQQLRRPHSQLVDRLGLPLVAAPVSGGTRMQEGTPAFVWMAQISAAVAAHKAAGLPYRFAVGLDDLGLT